MGVDEAAATVACPQCGLNNPAHQRFCGHCGAPLTIACPQCGHSAPIGQRFCGECGTVLVAAPEAKVEVAPAPEPEQDPPAPEPEPAAPAAIPAPAYDPPADSLVRESELQSLLARAHLQRMRALITDSRRTLDLALVVAQTLPPPAAAPVHEMIGDMLAAEERWESARDAYEQALAIEPTRASAERKFGEMVVKINDEAAMARLGGESTFTPQDETVRDRLDIATVCTIIAPGLGQIVLGQRAKGFAFLAIFLATLAFALFSPKPEARSGPLPGRRVRVTSQDTDMALFLWLKWAAVVIIWSIAVADIARQARRANRNTAANPVPGGDRAGWEP